MVFCFQVLMVKGLMVKGLFPRLDALYPTEAEACRDRVKQHPSLVSRLSQAIGAAASASRIAKSSLSANEVQTLRKLLILRIE
ncbi:hypothetical protein [Frateuria aurantia]|uniref:hypothetical protein n=1 Tax=Frateuria aurantia TaxID=81475 RepID=UPI00059DE782|nr:hypothetical protein [Frateuria aurantia]